jgi:transcriptional regulator with XRE-family HTH domain
VSKVHIGKKIREVLRKAGYTSVEDFAKEIGLSRNGLYKIFEKQFIDTDLLRKISTVLKHDFFSYFSQDLALVKESKDSFGFATKDEVNAVLHLVEKLNKRFDDLEERLPLKKKPAKKKYKKEPKPKP